MSSISSEEDVPTYKIIDVTPKPEDTITEIELFIVQIELPEISIWNLCTFNIFKKKSLDFVIFSSHSNIFFSIFFVFEYIDLKLGTLMCYGFWLIMPVGMLNLPADRSSS